jgi:hypothetical protein
LIGMPNMIVVTPASATRIPRINKITDITLRPSQHNSPAAAPLLWLPKNFDPLLAYLQ